MDPQEVRERLRQPPHRNLGVPLGAQLAPLTTSLLPKGLTYRSGRRRSKNQILVGGTWLLRSAIDHTSRIVSGTTGCGAGCSS